jgi:hypothetical protein
MRCHFNQPFTFNFCHLKSDQSTLCSFIVEDVKTGLDVTRNCANGHQ